MESFIAMRCTECGSERIGVFRNQDTGAPAKQDGPSAAQCLDCQHMFVLLDSELIQLPDAPGTCHSCGYDLRAHATGQRCPECGAFVLPSHDAQLLRRPGSTPTWLLVAGPLVLIATMLLMRSFPSVSTEILLSVAGATFMGHGVMGLKRGTISFYAGLNTPVYYGRTAVFFSILTILIGASLLGFGIVGLVT